MKTLLSNLKWEVTGHWPWVPLKETSMELGQKLRGVTPALPASVPGGVHYDVYQAGMIADPWYGVNSLACEWIENRWWMYRTEFGCPEAQEGRRARLIFEGLDYDALIYLNGELIGEHKGMYEPFAAEVSGKLKKERNVLIVILKGVPDEMGQIGHTSMTSTQKSRFNYKWDFSTHLVNIGIWKNVILKLYEDVEMEEAWVRSDYDGEKGIVEISGNLWRAGEKNKTDGVPVCVSLTECGAGQTVYEERMNLPSDFCCSIEVLDPKLWYPNGCGEQPLYLVSVRYQDRVLWERRIGIRHISYEQNEGAPADSLPYTFIVNGRKVFIKGMNITPLDHLYGNVTDEQYDFLTDIAVNANVNLLRVWGGGLIEKEILYDLCDKKGILIWQEFIQSSSGIDNKPCEDRDFLELLRRNSTAAVKEKRSHTCLAVWSGGNELTEEENRPCGYGNRNIAMLKEIVEEYDPGILFLPTSASGPREFMSFENGRFTELGVTHDVHGGSNYGGNPNHYIKYEGADHLFHSEYGMDGMTSMKSIRKFMPKEDQYPTTMGENPRWMHHGDWWGTYYRDTEMFGELTDLKLFADCSRYMQAEGLRFIVEANRRKAPRCSGSIIWQLNEPWPNICCTNLLDYYGETKPAYYAVKRAYAAHHASMTYLKLDYAPGETFREKVFVHSPNGAYDGSLTVRVRLMDGAVVWERTYSSGDGRDTRADGMEIPVEYGTVSFEVPDAPVFFVELDPEGADRNVYLFSTEKTHPFMALTKAQTKVACEVKACVPEEDGMEVTAVLTNTGSSTAVHAGVELVSDTLWMVAQDNYVTLFPGEEKEIVLHVRPKRAGGFLEKENHPKHDPVKPELAADWFGR